MKQLTIYQRLFLLLGVIMSAMLFVQCPKSCKPSNLSPTQFEKFAKKEKSKKDLLRVRQLPSRNAHYIEITIQPFTIGTELSQYSLTAPTVSGDGILLAPVDKVKTRLQYTLPLTKETKLDQIYLSKGNSDIFKQGKSIQIKCVYQPKAGTQEGENHQLQMKVCSYNKDHQIMEQQTKEISLLMTQRFNEQNTKTTKFAQKYSSHTDNKRNQANVIDRKISLEDKFKQAE